MDVSYEYVKMCIAATEIQAEWKPKVGDFYKDGKYNDIDVMQYPAGKLGSDDEDFGYWWLPRIDQLQELSEESWQTFYSRLDRDLNSAEIAGLKRVMRLKYQLHWCVDKWVTFDEFIQYLVSRKYF